MALQETLLQVKDTTSNPAPLGLLGFGMTTVLLNFHNAGFYGLDTMILGMGIFYGGLAQIIAGIMEWKKNNTFGTTAFTSYGLFWLTLVALLVLPKMGWGEVTIERRYGRLPVYVGAVHSRHVYRDAQAQPGSSVRFCVADYPFLDAGAR